MNLKLDLSKKLKYVVAISGGVDSMVLLHALIHQKFDIVVVHFNHQKRDESILDHELIDKVCHTHKIPYHYIKLSIKNGNFQEVARNLRYKNLISIANDYKTNHIITAHHGDDLTETILMKMIRGSNLFGYASMQNISQIDDFYYYKPLLLHDKTFIYAYANEHNVLFNEDHSNKSNDYFRNRIRNNVIPLIKDENNIVEHFYQFSNQAYQAANYIRTQSKHFLNGELSFNLKAFNELHIALKADIISYIFEVVKASKSYEKIYKIIDSLGNDKPNLSFKMNKDFTLYKSYDLVHIKTLSDKVKNIHEDVLNISHKSADSPYNSIELCYNKLDFPIKVRTRLPGDVLSFPYGHKKLKSFFIEKKVPQFQRDTVLIVTDSKNEILWIPNLYINQTLGNSNKIYFSIKE